MRLLPAFLAVMVAAVAVFSGGAGPAAAVVDIGNLGPEDVPVCPGGVYPEPLFTPNCRIAASSGPITSTSHDLVDGQTFQVTTSGVDAVPCFRAPAGVPCSSARLQNIRFYNPNAPLTARNGGSTNPWEHISLDFSPTTHGFSDCLDGCTGTARYFSIDGNLPGDCKGKPAAECTLPQVFFGPVLMIVQWDVMILPASGGQVVQRWTWEEVFRISSRIQTPTQNQPPHASFTWHVSGDDPLTLSFDGSGSTDDTGVVAYEWTIEGQHPTGATPPPHMFPGPGTYPVVLTVRDAAGLSDSLTLDVKVATGLVVNSVADTGEPSGDAGDGACDTGATVLRNGTEEPECTLRAAVIEANALPGPNTITFDVPGGAPEIVIGRSLPLGGGMTVDGTSQEGVLIRGQGSNIVSAFELDGEANVIRGLSVEGAQIGITARGASQVVSSSRIHGTDTGIRVVGSGATIGGSTTPGSCDQDCNLLSGGRAAVRVETGATGTTIAGNYVGLTDSGVQLDFSGSGIVVEAGSSATLVGGPSADLRNVIGTDPGVVLHAPARVEGNYVGLGPDGAPLVGPGSISVQLTHGIVAENASSVVIGGSASNGEAPGNAIGAARSAAIQLKEVDVAVVTGNSIGPRLAEGLGPVTDTGFGVCVVDSANVRIGTPSGGNVISDNGRDGIEVARSTGVVIEANHIGTDGSGTSARPNENGISIRGGRDLRVEGNLVSGNRARGIWVTPEAVVDTQEAEFDDLNCAQSQASTVELPSGVTIRGNTVGTDAAGAQALGNGDVGIAVTANAAAFPGATGTPEFHVEGNLISGNGGSGASLDSNGLGAPFPEPPMSTFTGNLVGTDRSGTRAIPNGGGSSGAANVDGSAWLVGGVRPTLACESPCNLVSGNSGHGLVVASSGSIRVIGNVVGRAREETAPLPNGGAGVVARGTTPGAVAEIGGVGAGEGNVVAYNGGPGIAVESFAWATVRGNRLFDNGALGIDLGSDGVTPNDSALDPDDGPNGLLNMPRIDSVDLRDGTLRVTGFAPTPLDPLGFEAVDLYGNRACDPSGFGEGEFLLASTSVGPLAEGFFSFELPLDPQLGFTAVSATLTVGKATSELSPCVAIGAEEGAALTAAAPAGSTRLEVPSSAGLVGKVVALGTGPTLETNLGVRTGSLILARPTRFAHEAGEPVVARDDTLFVSVDTAVITRSSRLPDIALLRGRVQAVQGRSVACGEDVTLTLGGATVAQKVPGTKFARQSGKRCVFVAKTEHGIGRFELDLGKGGTWNAQVIRRDLEHFANPLEVGLRIGDDAGAESLRLRTVGAIWTYAR